MKQLLFFFFFLPVSFAGFAQMTPYTPPAKQGGSDEREGLYGGISLGYFHYKTYWYYYGSGSPYYDNNAAHSINRFVVSANIEKKALLTANPFQFDLGAEVLIGPAGKAKATYLSGDNTISSGGWSAGLYPYIRAVYLPSSARRDIQVLPFLSLGPQYMFLHNNGKGSSSTIEEYDYAGGWNEGVLMLTASAGIELRFDDITVTPELRFGLFGWNSSSWEPGGHDVTMNGGPGFLAFSVRLSKRL